MLKSTLKEKAILIKLQIELFLEHDKYDHLANYKFDVDDIKEYIEDVLNSNNKNNGNSGQEVGDSKRDWKTMEI